MMKLLCLDMVTVVIIFYEIMCIHTAKIENTILVEIVLGFLLSMVFELLNLGYGDTTFLKCHLILKLVIDFTEGHRWNIVQGIIQL